jgi:hypothetical protein
MQIGSASLLVAQQQVSAQQKPQASVFGSFLNAAPATPKDAARPAFAPADFAKAEPEKSAATSPATAAQPFRPPGSALDIRV